MSGRVDLTPQARNDLLEQYDCYENQGGFDLAGSFCDVVESTLRLLADSPGPDL